ncbi:uncharacterized protein LOC144660588 isoform X1 [Oculina patagonica]
MKKQSLLFYAICLLFALAAKGSQGFTFDTQDSLSFEDKTNQEDASIVKREDPVPVAFYPLNGEFQANEKNDRQPSGILNGVELADGPHNEPEGAYQFFGNAGSYIEFPNDGGLDTRNSITLMCWVQRENTEGPLFNYRKSGPWGVHIWIVNSRFFNRITKYPNHAFANAILTDDPLDAGRWYHVAATYNHNTGENSIYVDGVLAKTQNIGTGFRIATNDTEVRMGVKDGDGRHFKGNITQMKVYDVALDADQIKAAMKDNASSVTICEHDRDTISCPEGEVIRVQHASYGRHDDHTCPDPRILTTNCHAGNSLSIVKANCDNQASCNLFSSNSVFGDPCVGTYKYLEVDYKCIGGGGSGGAAEPCDSSPCLNGATCTNQGDSFECECAEGFGGNTCGQDVDECAHNNGGCQDICVNTIGGYYCACSDPQFSVAPDKRHCIAEGVELDCGQDEMTITLPKSLLVGLDVDHIRLIDVHCTATENETHYFLHTATTECGTILKHTNDHAVYSNMVSEIPIEEHQIVTRVREAMIPFHCYYSKYGVVSSIGILPASKKVILSSKGYGKFTITMDLYRNPNFIEPYSQDDFPVMFNIRERMYYEIRVDTEDDRLTILALECYATPSQDRDSQPRYDVIRDGCSVDDDDTLKFHPRADPQSQRFSLEAFQYVSKHPYVFFHCKVQICNATDPNSRCAQGCIARRRRGAKPLPESADDTYALAQGPLTLDREKREAEADEAADADQSMRVANKGMNLSVVAALAVVIGACAVGMGYMAWQKKKGAATRKFIPLYEDLQN